MSTVAIVDDHRAFSDRLGAFVNALPGWSVVGSVEDAVAGLELVRSLHPSVVLVDVGLPDRNGLWFTERVLTTTPKLRVILMSDAEPEEYADAAAQAGAIAYLPKHAISRDLPALLRGAARNGSEADRGRKASAFGPVGGPSSGSDAAVEASLLKRSTLSLVDFVLAWSVFAGFALAGQALLGAAIAVALLLLHRRWPPPRARRGRAGERRL